MALAYRLLCLTHLLATFPSSSLLPLRLQDCVATINGSKVNTCLAYGGSGGAAGAGVIATGHPDGVV